MLIFVFKFIRTHRNEIIILLFVQQKRKHGEMAFLTSRSASKRSFCSWCQSYSQGRQWRLGFRPSVTSYTLCSVVQD